MSKIDAPALAHPPIKMTRRHRTTELVRPGDFAWIGTGDCRCMKVVVPLTCLERGTVLTIKIATDRKTGGRKFWNGSVSRPSVAGIIRANGFWKGRIKGGNLVQA